MIKQLMIEAERRVAHIDHQQEFPSIALAVSMNIDFELEQYGEVDPILPVYEDEELWYLMGPRYVPLPDVAMRLAYYRELEQDHEKAQ